MKVNDTKYRWKKVANADGVQVNIFCVRYMPGISVISRAEVDEKGVSVP